MPNVSDTGHNVSVISHKEYFLSKRREMLHYPPAVLFTEPGKTIHYWLAQWLPDFPYMLASSLPMASTRVSNMTCICENEHEGQQTVLRRTK